MRMMAELLLMVAGVFSLVIVVFSLLPAAIAWHRGVNNSNGLWQQKADSVDLVDFFAEANLSKDTIQSKFKSCIQLNTCNQ